MKRIVALVYGFACYGVFLVTLLYAIGFIGNFGVPKTMDSGPEGSVAVALAIDGALLALFALQHSVMARPWFKRLWTRIVPEPVERSTYVLFSSVALLLMFWQWRPIGGVIWSIDDVPAAAVVFWLVFGRTADRSAQHIPHQSLRPVRTAPGLSLRLRCEIHAAGVSHALLLSLCAAPLYLGWLLTFWSAPVMTVAHLFFAVMTTAYIFVAIRFEEADLVNAYGEKYRRYRNQVPMIVPALGAKTANASYAPPQSHKAST